MYDGDNFNATLLGSFSGRTDPQSMVATSGNMLILLYSDTNYVLNGFSATYYISNCLNHCHNHGKCVGHQCVCHGEWVGPDCEDEVCPDKCGEYEARGRCIKGVCKCNEVSDFIICFEIKEIGAMLWSRTLMIFELCMSLEGPGRSAEESSFRLRSSLVIESVV